MVEETNENQPINEIPTASTVSGAKILGIAANGDTNLFPVSAIKGDYKGLALAGTNPGTPVLSQYYDAKPGVTYTNFLDAGGQPIAIPTSVGGNPVVAAKLSFNGTNWVGVYNGTEIELAEYAKTDVVDANFVKLETVGENILNAVDGLISGEAYWTDGTVKNGSGYENYLRTPLFPIKGGVEYNFSGYMDAAFNAIIHFFDINKNYIGFYQPSPVTTSNFEVNFTSPFAARFFGTNVRTLNDYDPNSLMIVEGTEKVEFKPFITQFTKPVNDIIQGKELIFKNDMLSTPNLADPDKIQLGKNLVNSSPGAVINDSTRQVLTINTVKSNQEYSISILDQDGPARINMYSENGSYIAPSVEVVNGNISFETYPGTKILKIAYDKVPSGLPNRIMVQEGLFTGYTPFEPTGLIDKNNLSNAIKTRSSAYNMFLVGKKSLGAFINALGQIVTGLDKNKYSYIRVPVVEGKTYTLFGDTPNTKLPLTDERDNSGNVNFITIRFENSSGESLGYTGFYAIDSFNAYASFPIKFETPIGCTKVVIPTMGGDGYDQTDSFILNEGTELFEYYQQFSSLLGKRVVFLGDSVTFLNKHQPFIAEKLRFNWWNNGVPGALVTPGYENIIDDGIRRSSFVERIEKIQDFNPDLLVITVGFNDPIYGAVLGNIDSPIITPTFTSGQVDPLSVLGATFYGSLKYLVKRFFDLCPGRKVVFMTSHQFGTGSYDLKRAFAMAGVEVARLYAIPCLNRFDTSGINDFTKSVYTVDDLHLSTLGGKITADQAISFLNS
jgi:lysophospholipase L1-like esterase